MYIQIYVHINKYIYICILYIHIEFFCRIVQYVYEQNRKMCTMCTMWTMCTMCTESISLS